MKVEQLTAFEQLRLFYCSLVLLLKCSIFCLLLKVEQWNS